MSGRKPKVVALIPAYKAGRYLKPSVESLLGQTRRPDRIVVIDDASPDDAADSLKHFVDRGEIELRANERNLGKAATLNRCFEEMEADYFLLQDADDVAMPERVERQLAFMEANPGIGCSSCYIEYIGSRGKRVGTGRLDLLNEDRLREYLASDEPFGLFCPGAILRGEVVKRQRLRFRGQFWPADDIDLWNRIAEAGWLVLAQPEVLVRYRIHGSSAVTSSFTRTRMQYEWLRACLRARRRGASEPTRKEFLQAWSSAPWWQRLNRRRAMMAKAWYRGAGFSYAEGAFIRAALQASGSLVLQPRYFVARLFQQAGRRLLKLP